VRVRTAGRDDLAAVAAVCRATARGGDPVAPTDPAADLLPAVYAEPYVHLEPASARLLVDESGTVMGYVVAAVDSAAFYRRWRRDWSPRFAAPVGPTSEEVQHLHALLAHPEQMLPGPATLAGHPSHLHIDLLPQARGGGWGQRLLAHALAGLADAGSPGVHLGVDPANLAAQRFYRRAGFRLSETDSDGDTLVLVRGCAPPPPAQVTAGG
jgi:ribosomal protein S18 acetylase RimI-like enzyme